MADSDPDADSGSGRSTLMNALIGGAVTVVLSFVPFSPLLGGGVAGYLEEGELGEGAVVGGLAGVVATIPVALVLALVGGLFIALPAGTGASSGFAILGLVFLVAVVAVGIYAVGLSVVGGMIGAYVAAETDVGGRARG